MHHLLGLLSISMGLYNLQPTYHFHEIARVLAKPSRHYGRVQWVFSRPVHCLPKRQAYHVWVLQGVKTWCRGQDSNLRSITQRILSPPPLTAREPRLMLQACNISFLIIPLRSWFGFALDFLDLFASDYVFVECEF